MLIITDYSNKYNNSGNIDTDVVRAMANLTNPNSKVSFDGVDSGGATVVIIDITSTATLTGWSSIDASSIIVTKIGKSITVNFYISGTSDSDAATLDLPYAALATALTFTNPISTESSFGSNQKFIGAATLDGNRTTISLYVNSNLTDQWATTGIKTVQGQINYITN